MRRSCFQHCCLTTNFAGETNPVRPLESYLTTMDITFTVVVTCTMASLMTCKFLMRFLELTTILFSDHCKVHY